MKKTVIYSIIKILIAAVPMVLLINKKLNTDSGNNGMGIDLSLLAAFLILVIWGIFMICETVKFFYQRNKKNAVINILIMIPVLAVFIYIGGM
ncbi:hypothetical protein VUJ46_09365 [Chryseobacterium sp. MYb264]|uniref:hypothetical protein n=1 Tax=Chryseobacterium sp. MYb264 TaxID=2745153 RepID=UPI002E0DE2FE|nr:hypothetical protein VUJ46_09365 [Chryseobacterium sp. MYb264]